jgi:hypothetical protein
MHFIFFRLVQQNKPNDLISLDRYVENDFYLTCGILNNFLLLLFIHLNEESYHELIYQVLEQG